jgi:hypothetical protein
VSSRSPATASARHSPRLNTKPSEPFDSEGLSGSGGALRHSLHLAGAARAARGRAGGGITTDPEQAETAFSRVIGGVCAPSIPFGQKSPHTSVLLADASRQALTKGGIRLLMCHLGRSLEYLCYKESVAPPEQITPKKVTTPLDFACNRPPTAASWLLGRNRGVEHSGDRCSIRNR